MRADVVEHRRRVTAELDARAEHDRVVVLGWRQSVYTGARVGDFDDVAVFAQSLRDVRGEHACLIVVVGVNDEDPAHARRVVQTASRARVGYFVQNSPAWVGYRNTIE
jgi:RecA-family ATPase